MAICGCRYGRHRSPLGEFGYHTKPAQEVTGALPVYYRTPCDDIIELCSRIHARPDRSQHQPQGSPDGLVQAGRDHLGPAASEHVADGGRGLVRDLPAQRVTHLPSDLGALGSSHHVHRERPGAVPGPGPPRAHGRRPSSLLATGPPQARTRPTTQAGPPTTQAGTPPVPVGPDGLYQPR